MLISTPIGPLTLFASDAGLTRISFGGAGSGSSPLLIDAASQLAEYFTGQRHSFHLPVDVPDAGFHGQVQAALVDIPFGQTVSYSALAATCGREKAVRAVGTACAINPLPIIRPCHRVVRADGSMGGYLGGIEAKQWLLNHEQRVLGNQ